MKRTASCSCGQLEVTCSGDPVRISVCHCYACQKRTGSAFGVQARFPSDATEIRGDSTTFTRTGDSGGTIDFHFCPKCGSTVFYRIAEFVAVPVGGFADRDFPEPRVGVYETRRHPWVNIATNAAMEHYD